MTYKPDSYPGVFGSTVTLPVEVSMKSQVPEYGLPLCNRVNTKGVQYPTYEVDVRYPDYAFTLACIVAGTKYVKLARAEEVSVPWHLTWTEKEAVF